MTSYSFRASILLCLKWFFWFLSVCILSSCSMLLALVYVHNVHCPLYLILSVFEFCFGLHFWILFWPQFLNFPFWPRFFEFCSWPRFLNFAFWPQFFNFSFLPRFLNFVGNHGLAFLSNFHILTSHFFYSTSPNFFLICLCPAFISLITFPSLLLSRLILDFFDPTLYFLWYNSSWSSSIIWFPWLFYLILTSRYFSSFFDVFFFFQFLFYRFSFVLVYLHNLHFTRENISVLLLNYLSPVLLSYPCLSLPPSLSSPSLSCPSLSLSFLSLSISVSLSLLLPLTCYHHTIAKGRLEAFGR